MTIPLSQGKFALIDENDLSLTEGRSWYFTHGYARSDTRAERVYLHRLIMGNPTNGVVDHINGNRLDNRRSNLRIVSHAENIRNRTKLNKNNKSGHRGVFYAASKNKWIATYRRDYKKVTIGTYDSREEAVKAYESKEGSYAVDNYKG